MASLQPQTPASYATSSLNTTPVVHPLASTTTANPHHYGAPQQSTSGNVAHTSSLSGGTPLWLPITLRWPYLCTVIVFNLLILVLVIVLHIISHTHSGLGNNHGSSAIYFTTNFLPTVVAVVYVFMLSALLDDIKRTEPYARAAAPGGAPVANSLFMPGGAWWNALVESLPDRKRYRTFSPPLLCTTLAFLLGFTLISPFSSTFLVSQDVLFTENQSFEQLSLSPDLPISAASTSSTTYYRTIGNVLQNVTTSAWIMNNYAVLPFWPINHPEKSMGAILDPISRVWTAENLVISTELECEPLHSTGRSIATDPDHVGNDYYDTLPKPLLGFKTNSGCAVSLFLDNSTAGYAIAAWIIPNTPVGSYYRFYSSNCTGDDLLIFTSSSYLDQGSNKIAPNPNYEVRGAMCSAAYYFANVTVKVTGGAGESIISVDETSYRRNRRRVPQSFLDTRSIQTLFLNNSEWNQRLYKDYDRRMLTFGPAAVLAATNDFYSERLMRETTIATNATMVKQRFLGEMLRDVFDSALSSERPKTKIMGSIQSTRSRVMVVPAVAMILEAVLGFNLVMLFAVSVFSGLRRRPLGLSCDPSNTIAVAGLMSNNPNMLRLLDNANVTNPSELFSGFGDHWISVVSNTIHLLGVGPSNSRQRSSLLKKIRTRGRLSAALNMSTINCLITSILAILITVLVLLALSETQGLYQTAFVYQLDFRIGSLELNAVNPASILTTLLAVLLGLWWGAVDSNLRLLQPFLALVEAPVKGRDGASLSYQTSYMLWAAFRAVKRRHWLLALVSCGAFYAEILTIAMSALWSREHGRRSFDFTIPVSLEVRQVPLLRVAHVNSNDYFSSSAGGNLLSEVFANQTTSWMYGASIQLALNGSEPRWSSNGWSFAPLDLSTLPSRRVQKLGEGGDGQRTETVAEVETIGVHARLECRPYDNLGNISSWLTKHDLTNGTYWNTSVNPTSLKSGYELGTLDCASTSSGRVRGWLCGTVGGARVSTTFYGLEPQLSCCQNFTNNEYHNASIGYWSPSGIYSLIASPTTKFPFNLTVKWIRGTPHEGYKTNKTTIPETAVGGASRHLIWQEAPAMTALDCQPIIETASARVVIDTSSYRVLNYSLLSTPVSDRNAWTEGFVEHYPVDYAPNGSNEYPINMTVSYGSFFLSALMSAFDLSFLSITPRGGFPDFENNQRETYTISKQGLNTDYMSYSMYALAGFDDNALLDEAIMQRTAQKTFSTFFQHYASTVFTANTSWVFGKLDERLPVDLTTITSPEMASPPTKPRTGETTTIRVQQPVEVLQMSRAAAGIAMFAMTWLVITAMMLACTSRRYKTMFEWRVETIADVMAMLVGSTRLLDMLEEKGPQHMKYGNDAMAELSHFVPEGSVTRRWGIELAKRPLAPILPTAVVAQTSTTSSPSSLSSAQSSNATPTASMATLSIISSHQGQMATLSPTSAAVNLPADQAQADAGMHPAPSAGIIFQQPLETSPPLQSDQASSPSASSPTSVTSDATQPSANHYGQPPPHSEIILNTPPQLLTADAPTPQPQLTQQFYDRPPRPGSPVSPMNDDHGSLLMQEQEDVAATYSASIPLENLARSSSSQDAELRS